LCQKNVACTITANASNMTSMIDKLNRENEDCGSSGSDVDESMKLWIL